MLIKPRINAASFKTGAKWRCAGNLLLGASA
jgi:hypothetical protein